MDITMKTKLDNEIEMAFKARGLKESMQQWDAEMRQIETDEPTFVPINNQPHSHHHHKWQEYKQVIKPLIPRVFAPIAIAAMLAGVFFMPFGWHASTIGKGYTSENIEQFASLRGSGDAANYITEAYSALVDKKFSDAAKLSQEAIKLLRNADDPFQVDMLQDAEWYNALANLSRGQLWFTIKAKKDIKRIATNPGKHQDDAKDLLKRLEQDKR